MLAPSESTLASPTSRPERRAVTTRVEPASAACTTSRTSRRSVP